ncbi:DHR11-like protein, partial [Mya arenaria]
GLADSLKDTKGSLTAIKCDVSKEEDILNMFENIKIVHGDVDVCVCNAGLSHNSPLLSGATDQWRSMFDVNVIGLMTCSREAYKSMKENGVDDGHIILMGSIAGHGIVPGHESFNCYCATKFAVRAITEGMRNELYAAKTHILVTKFVLVWRKLTFLIDITTNPEAELRMMLTCDQITDSVIYALSASQRVQAIQDVVIATAKLILYVDNIYQSIKKYNLSNYFQTITIIKEGQNLKKTIARYASPFCATFEKKNIRQNAVYYAHV